MHLQSVFVESRETFSNISVAASLSYPIPVHHYNVVMGAIVSQITNLTIVYSIVYSDGDQRKHQSSASLAFVRGSHQDRWIPRTNGQLRGKYFHLMTSSWVPLKSISEIDCCQTVCVIMGCTLTHWGRDIMVDIYQTTISNSFSWTYIYMIFDEDFIEVCSQVSN